MRRRIHVSYEEEDTCVNTVALKPLPPVSGEKSPSSVSVRAFVRERARAREREREREKASERRERRESGGGRERERQRASGERGERVGGGERERERVHVVYWYVYVSFSLVWYARVLQL
jgi:hypothetical protein